MRRRSRNGQGWRDRGAAAVELAIVFPLLLLIIAGIVDFGRFFLTEIQLTNAVREGARVAVLGESSANVIIRTQAAAPSVDGLAITTPGLCSAGGGGNAKVAATATFDWILLGPAMNMFGAAGALPQAKAEAVMRCGG